MRRGVVGLALATLLLAVTPAAAQDDGKLELSLSGSLRVRGSYLSSRTIERDLDPTTRLSLRLSGNDRIDSTQEFLDTRLRLQLRATAFSEVTAFMAIEVGDITFGVENQGGDLGTDGIVFENKNLYLEWHPTRYTFKVKAGLYPRESDPYGLILSNDVAGIHAEVELLGTGTTLYADVLKAVEASRLDLDADGEIDNDYNDRTIFLAGLTNTFIPNLALELFLAADIDNTQDTPVANTEQDVYWLGLTANTRVGPFRLATVGIGSYGKRTVTGTPGVHLRGFAIDQRITVELPFVTIEGIFGWASGRDPDRRTTDTGFQTITPFYGVSGIVYSNFGGLNVTGSDLAGTAHTTIKLRTTPMDGFDIETVFLYAWYTADRDTSTNVNQFNRNARDIGFEADLNLSYEILEGFKAFAKGSIFFPGHGYQVQRDTRRGGNLSQVIIGAQFSF